MDIKKGLNLKGNPAEIPDCSRDDLPAFFKEMGYEVGVEIGVYKGEYLKLFCEAGLKMYGVDPWLPYIDFDIESENRIQRQDFLFGHAKKFLEPYKNCSLVRKMSMDAVKDFEDESLDFVYIDGNHRFKYIAEDLCEWTKKVKKGGAISGHDYIHPRRVRGDRDFNLQVKFVVDAFTEAFQIDNWYVLGERDAPKEDKRDRFRSWLWIKK